MKSPMSKSQDSNKEQAKIALMQWVKQNVSLGEDQVQNSAVSETMSEKSPKKQFTTSKKPKSSSKVKGKSPAVEPTNFDADFDVSMDFPNDHSDLCWSDTTTPSVQRKQRNMLKRGKNREMEIDSDYVCSPTFSEIDRNQITPNRRRSFTGSSTQSESTSGDYHLRRSSRRSTSGRSSTVSSPTHSNQNCCDDCGDACSSAIVLEYHRLLVHLKMILTKFSDTAFLVFPNDPNSSVICVQCLEEVKSINLESHLHSCQYNYLEDELEKYWDNRLQNAQSSGRNENDSQGMLQYVDDFLPRKLFSVQGRLYQCNYCTEVFLHISKKSKHEQELHTEELDRSKPQTENITTDTLPNPSDSNSKQKIGPKANECNSKPKVTPKFTPKSKVGHRARAAPTIFYKGDAQTTAKLISNMVVKQITSTLKSFLLKIENSLNPLLSRRKNRFAKIKNPKHFTRRSQNAQEKLNVNESSLTAPPNIENSDRYKDQGLGPLEQSQTIFDDYLMQIEKPRMLDLDPLEEFFGSSALGNGPNLFSKTVNNIESEWEEFVDLNYSNAEEFVFSQAATVANEPIDDQRDGNKEQCNVALPLEPNSRIKPKPKSATGEDPKVDIHEKDSLEMEGDTQVEITEDALNGESGNVQFTVGKRAETHLPKTLSIGEPVVSNCQTNGLPVDHQIDNGASGMDIDPLEVASDVDSDDNEDAPIVFSGIPSDDDFESVDLAEDTRAEECNLSSGKDVATTFNASSTNRLNQILHTETEMDVAVYTLESDCTYQSEDEQRVSTGKTVNEECESIDFTDGDEKKNIEAVNTNDVLPPVIQDKEISAVDCEENQNLEPNLKCAPALPTNPQIEIDAQVGSKLDIPQSETGTTVGEVQKYPKEYSAQERVVVDSNGGSFSKEDQTVYQPNDKNIESLTPPAESQESDEDQIVSSGKTIVDETESNDLTDGNQNEECSKMDVLNHETTNTKCKDLAPSPTAESADTLHENDISQLENDKLISQDNLISCNERMDETISESETASIDMDFQSDTNSPKKIHTQSRNTAPKKLIAKLPSSNSFSSDEETASICLGSEPKSPSEVRLEITDTPTKYNILTEIYKVTPEQTSKKRDFSSIEGLVSSNRVAVEELSTRIRKLNGTLDEAENYIMNCFKKSSPEPAFKKQKTQ
ncbi:hypothetical protein HK103_002049 [Boothiomyces macroporosus]|uniref:C2H2-type domain-containing protein n=1 Tax=Boothiomyces macroporosus TaxID=261099 RepID=A0AAD5U9W0_9FUNG|nr:hypothetical protein HK103_002049 [Boothiomyces macroporosus]